MAKKIHCKECDALILPSTAKQTGGVCMPCKNGTRVYIDASKGISPKQNKCDPFLITRAQDMKASERIARLLRNWREQSTGISIPPDERRTLHCFQSENLYVGSDWLYTSKNYKKSRYRLFWKYNDFVHDLELKEEFKYFKYNRFSNKLILVTDSIYFVDPKTKEMERISDFDASLRLCACSEASSASKLNLRAKIVDEKSQDDQVTNEVIIIFDLETHHSLVVPIPAQIIWFTDTSLNRYLVHSKEIIPESEYLLCEAKELLFEIVINEQDPSAPDKALFCINLLEKHQYDEWYKGQLVGGERSDIDYVIGRWSVSGHWSTDSIIYKAGEHVGCSDWKDKYLELSPMISHQQSGDYLWIIEHSHVAERNRLGDVVGHSHTNHTLVLVNKTGDKIRSISIPEVKNGMGDSENGGVWLCSNNIIDIYLPDGTTQGATLSDTSKGTVCTISDGPHIGEIGEGVLVSTPYAMVKKYLKD